MSKKNKTRRISSVGIDNVYRDLDGDYVWRASWRDRGDNEQDLDYSVICRRADGSIISLGNDDILIQGKCLGHSADEPWLKEEMKDVKNPQSPNANNLSGEAVIADLQRRVEELQARVKKMDDHFVAIDEALESNAHQ